MGSRTVLRVLLRYLKREMDTRRPSRFGSKSIALDTGVFFERTLECFSRHPFLRPYTVI